MSQISNKEQAADRIKRLRKEIDRIRYAYHVLDQQIVSDEVKDSLQHELAELEARYPDLIRSDSPTQRVAGKALPGFAKVTHVQRMLSLNDVFSFAELSEWADRIGKLLLPGALAESGFYAELKMDGLAVSLEYEEGQFVRGSTRGDGRVGENITENLKTIEAIPLRLDPEILMPHTPKELRVFVERALKGRLEVRGEVYLPVREFERVNREQAERSLPTFANPRNAAAGALRQLDASVTAARRLAFFAYDVVTDHGQSTHEEAHQLAQVLGFPTNEANRWCKDLSAVEDFYNLQAKRREKLPYWIDGVVVVVNDLSLMHQLGVVGKTPRGMVAYKFAPEEVTTVVRAIIVQVGRTGALTPVAEFDPVQVAGTIVSRATLHNADEVARKDVRIGDTVVVRKAGDIIPEVKEVLHNLRPKGTQPFQMPTQCPICHAKVERTETSGKEAGAVLRCINPHCFAQQLRQLQFFVSKGAFDIVGLGPKILEQLIEGGLIKSPADLFRLREGDLEPLERFAEAKASNIVQAIAMRRTIELGRFILALGIRNVGEETARDLAAWLTVRGDVQKANSKEWSVREFAERAQGQTAEDWQAVEDIGPVVAESITAYFREQRNQELLDELDAVGIRLLLPTSTAAPGKLAGQTFVFTGEMETMTRDEAKAKVRALGGDASESVSQKTSFVVVGADPGSKYNKAQKLGITVLSEQEFLSHIAM